MITLMIEVVREKGGQPYCDCTVTHLQDGEYPQTREGHVYEGTWMQALASLNEKYGDDIRQVEVLT